MIQLHPADNLDKKVNFWQEYPAFQFHKLFGEFYRSNKAKNLQNSSLFMWLLSACYDRKSAVFNQPELDKWEVVSEDMFDDEFFMRNLLEDIDKCKILVFNKEWKLHFIIDAFEKAIDTPLGITLRALEAKLVERAAFILATDYTMDYYHTTDSGRVVLKKGTADQLDRMFANTEKINTIIQKAMDALRVSETAGTTKGGQKESLSDGQKDF